MATNELSFYPGIVETSAPAYSNLTEVAGTFTPSSIPGLVAWYDAQSASTITQTGGAVSQWNDKSTSAINVTAASTARPTYSATGFNGSLPGVTFNGTTNVMEANALPFTDIPSITAFVVAVPSASASTQYMYGLGSFGDNMALGRASTAIFFAVGNQSFSGTTGLFTAGTPHYVQWGWDSSSQATYWNVDGTLDPASVGTFSGGTISVVNTFIGGNDGVFTGTIGEILVYNRVLTGTQSASVVSYIQGRWGF